MLGIGNINIGYKGIPASGGGGGTLDGAENGLSVDLVTGTKAVWGQEFGDPNDPAVLLSNREIPGAFTVVMPDGKFGIGEDTGAFLPGADQKLMVLSDLWTNGLRAACAFFRSMVTPTNANVLIDSIIPGSFSAHLRMENGSFIGGPGSVIAAVKANLVTQGADPALQTTLQLNSIDAGWLPIGLQNMARVALIRAQRPDFSVGATGVADEVIGILIESMDSAAVLGDPDRYGIKQEGADRNKFEGVMQFITSGEVFTQPLEDSSIQIRANRNNAIVLENPSFPFPFFALTNLGSLLIKTGTATPNFPQAAIEVGDGVGIQTGRMTEAERLAITLGDSLQNGFMVYQTDGAAPGFYGIEQESWVKFTTTPA